ncbi:MAG: GNAT family N-acetyltransferase [Candidatus Sungbacteria bacterium]|nr:GNAT family N-acetyltransferase [Candidatus Sungbacteria bacterium]
MLKGKKVILRPIDIERDLERCAVWINDYEVMQFLGKPFKPITKDQERSLLQKIISNESNVVFAIDTLEGVHIGITSLVHVCHFDGTAITGTFIGNKEYWGKGLGTDAKMVLLWYAFEVLNLRRINSHVLAFNERSVKCQLRCGYKVEGVKKQEVYKNGRYHDLVMMAVFRDDWLPLWREYQGLEEKSAESGRRKGSWVSAMD